MEAVAGRIPPPTPETGCAMKVAEAFEYRDLLRAADACRTANSHTAHQRAQQILAGAEAHCRAVAAVFDRQPALHVYIGRLTFGRPIALITELARQVCTLTGAVARDERAGVDHPRWPNTERWSEAQALAERLGYLAGQAVQFAPDLALHTEAGCHALGRRLVRVEDIAAAADLIEQAISSPLGLTHVPAEIAQLAAVAADLRGVASRLEAVSQLGPDRWTDMFMPESTPST